MVREGGEDDEEEEEEASKLLAKKGSRKRAAPRRRLDVFISCVKKRMRLLNRGWCTPGKKNISSAEPALNQQQQQKQKQWQ